jgi:hypothetical protein
MRAIRPFVGLLFLAVVAFWPLVLHPTETLYSNSSDFLAQHLPAKYFLVRSLRETGEVPLWNPEQYAGSPFVHDIQVGLFYPPHVPLYVISEPAIGPYLSWLVFAHVVMAGWLMFAYARHAGMGELAAFVAGVGFMLSPRWMMQLFLAGHTITQGICWLPLVLLCVERAIQRGRISWAVGGGLAYAMMILGTHPQWTFYASLLIGFWPLRLVHERRLASLPRKRGEEPAPASLIADYGEPGRVSAGSTSPPPQQSLPVLSQPGSPLGASTRTLLIRWFLVEALVVLIGLGLCAVQLLPILEAGGESSRAKGMGQSWSLDGAKAAMGTLIGPIPDKVAEPIHWETRGGIGFTWAILAVVGIRLGGRKTLVPAIIAGAMLAYALGGSYFIDRLPGFNNFRMPTRMLLTLAFPVAYFAAIGVKSLQHEKAKSVVRLATVFWMVVLLNFATIAFLGGNYPSKFTQVDQWWTIYWLVLIAGCILFLLLGTRLQFPQRAIAVTLLMVADVLILAVPLAESRPVDEIYPNSPIIDYIREHNSDRHRVYDVSEGSGFQSNFGGSGYHSHFLGPGSPAASVHGIPSILGYNPLDVARYRQFLAFVADIGESQRAVSGSFTHPVIAAFPIQNKRLLDLIGVRFQSRDAFIWLLDRSNPRAFYLLGSPTTYNFLGPGVTAIPGIALEENTYVLPRTFVVAQTLPQVSQSEVLGQLKSIDVGRTATLEDWDPAIAPLPQSSNPPGPAKLLSHSPNEIRIALDGRTAGLLVLTDPWYPGWVCRVDGKEVPIWKADYAFRGVMVEEGAKEVVFHFEPQSYRRGKAISLTTLFAVLGFFVAELVRSRFRKA